MIDEKDHHDRGSPPQDVARAFGTTPTIILVEPQLDENVGACARAMRNAALGDLRLVRPHADHLSLRAVRLSSGAEAILERARLFDNVEAAAADLNHVYAATARRRDMLKRLLMPRQAAAEMRAAINRGGEGCGVLFGPERSGLCNDDIASASAVIEIPLNPHFRSLNLAQAVLIFGYEWSLEHGVLPPLEEEQQRSPLATQDDLSNFYVRLERALDDSGFLRVAEKRPGMVRNLRAIFARAQLSRKEVSTLHGVIEALRQGGRR